MKKLFYVMLFLSSLVFGQNKLELKPSGFEPIVTEIEAKTAPELYKKTKEWIQTYYKDPKEVLKGDIENEMLRIEAYCSNCYQQKALGLTYNFGCMYSLEIEFKDGKYRYSYLVTRQLSEGKPVFYTWHDFFKKTGELKKPYQSSFDGMNSSANEIYSSLFNYISGKTEVVKKDW